MKNILHELYFGRVSRWERRVNRTNEELAVENKIQNEKKHFSQILSDEEYKRLNELEKLYGQFRDFDDMRTFHYAFRLGVMIMFAVFSGEDEEHDDEF